MAALDERRPPRSALLPARRMRAAAFWLSVTQPRPRLLPLFDECKQISQRANIHRAGKEKKKERREREGKFHFRAKRAEQLHCYCTAQHTRANSDDALCGTRRSAARSKKKARESGDLSVTYLCVRASPGVSGCFNPVRELGNNISCPIPVENTGRLGIGQLYCPVYCPVH